MLLVSKRALVLKELLTVFEGQTWKKKQVESYFESGVLGVVSETVVFEIHVLVLFLIHPNKYVLMLFEMVDIHFTYVL